MNPNSVNRDPSSKSFIFKNQTIEKWTGSTLNVEEKDKTHCHPWDDSLYIVSNCGPWISYSIYLYKSEDHSHSLQWLCKIKPSMWKSLCLTLHHSNDSHSSSGMLFILHNENLHGEKLYCMPFPLSSSKASMIGQKEIISSESSLVITISLTGVTCKSIGSLRQLCHQGGAFSHPAIVNHLHVLREERMLLCLLSSPSFHKRMLMGSILWDSHVGNYGCSDLKMATVMPSPEESSRADCLCKLPKCFQLAKSRNLRFKYVFIFF